MAKSKLKAALDREKGRDIRLEKQRKKEKAALKRKEKKAESDEDGDSDQEEDVNEGGVRLNGGAEQVVNVRKTREGKKVVAEEAEWETEEEEGDSDADVDVDEDDMIERPAVCHQ